MDMSLIAPTLFLMAILATLLALFSVRRELSTLKTHVERLLNEELRIETRRSELESELDVRIKRLLAREQYWRGEAARRSDSGLGTPESPEVPHVAEPRPTGESALDLRRRLRGA